MNAPPPVPHPESVRARRLAVLIEATRHVELSAAERDEITRLVSGRTEPSTQTDEVDHER